MYMPAGDASGAFRRWLSTIPPAATASVGAAALNKSWLGETWAAGICGLGMGNTLLPPNSPYSNAQILGRGAEDFDTPGVYGLSNNHPRRRERRLCRRFGPAPQVEHEHGRRPGTRLPEPGWGRFGRLLST